MCRPALDMNDWLPDDQQAYKNNFGWHFTEKACKFAVGLMKRKDSNGELVPITPIGKNEVEELLKRHGVTLKRCVGYDHVYVANKCKADNLGSSVPDEKHLALYVKNEIDDADTGDGVIMRQWYAKMVADGQVIPWRSFIKNDTY